MKDNTAQVVAQVPVDVATFLLNEKRPEIHGIETRFKVNVMLVPNTYLETPNYKVQRLRHDDLNQAEPLPASFDMVERPEEEDLARVKKEEAREPRPEAAVKGITPAQPAPVPVERAPEVQKRENWLTTVMGWFKRAPEEASPAAAQERKPAPREDFDRGRRDRRDRQGRRDRRDERMEERRDARRDGQRGGERQPQGSPQQSQRPDHGRDRRGERRDGQHEAKRDGERDAQRAAQREPQRQQQQRPQREAREPRAVDSNAPAITQEQPGAAPHGEGGGRRRRSRRRGRGDHHAQGETRVEQGQERLMAPIDAVPAATEMIAPASDQGTSALPIETAALTEPITPAPRLELTEAPAPSVQAHLPLEPIVPRNAPEIPRVSLNLPADSGLVLVETSHAASPQVEEESQPGPRRVRPPRVEVAEEPLQMVETTHKDPTTPAE
jgi:ribonuclease E